MMNSTEELREKLLGDAGKKEDEIQVVDTKTKEDAAAQKAKEEAETLAKEMASKENEARDKKEAKAEERREADAKLWKHYKEVFDRDMVVWWVAGAVISFDVFIILLTLWLSSKLVEALWVILVSVAGAVTLPCLVGIICFFAPTATNWTKAVVLVVASVINLTVHHFIIEAILPCMAYCFWSMMTVFIAKCVDPTDRLGMLGVMASCFVNAMVSVIFDDFSLHYIEFVLYMAVVLATGWIFRVDNDDVGMDLISMAWGWFSTIVLDLAAASGG